MRWFGFWEQQAAKIKDAAVVPLPYSGFLSLSVDFLLLSKRIPKVFRFSRQKYAFVCERILS